MKRTFLSLTIKNRHIYAEKPLNEGIASQNLKVYQQG